MSRDHKIVLGLFGWMGLMILLSVFALGQANKIEHAHAQEGLVFKASDLAAGGHITVDGSTATPNPFFATVEAAATGDFDAGWFPRWLPGRCDEFRPLWRAEGAQRNRPDFAAFLSIVGLMESGCQRGPLDHLGVRQLDLNLGQSCRGNSSTAYGLMQITTDWHYIPGKDWCDPLQAIPYAANKLWSDGFGAGDPYTALYRYNSGYTRTAEGDRYSRWGFGMYNERDLDTSDHFTSWCNAKPGVPTFGLKECGA